ncbi:MAG: hypothetical protein J5643_00545 [Lachnospiraceae bacterium]|nr:hypothetical protein [Lachnospiraceae bacterium]
MEHTFWAKLKEIFSNRLVPIFMVLCIAFIIIIAHIFNMQMVEPEKTKITRDEKSYTKTVSIPSTRGNIYDKSGNLLAYNELQFNLEMFNSAELTNNLEMNTAIYKLILILREYGYKREFAFPIAMDEEENLRFTISGSALDRFKKNAYGLKSVSDLTEKHKEATAEQVFNFMRFGDGVSRMFQIGEEYSKADALEIMAYRYQFFTMYPSYSSFRVVSNISDEARITFYENTTAIPGLEITKSSRRIYIDSEYFSHIIGYVGRVNAEELSVLKEAGTGTRYNDNSIVGKAGIEKSYETYLSGTDGEYTILINDRGQVRTKTITKEPVPGNDIYLTIDRERQICCYNIIKRNVAGILLAAIVKDMDYGSKGEDATDITIPIYEVYYALFSNHIINTDHFSAPDATKIEKDLLYLFEKNESYIWENYMKQLEPDCDIYGDKVSKMIQEYLDFMYQKLGSNGWGIVNSSKINVLDPEYISFTNKKSSLSHYLQYAITQGWINLDKLNIGEEYYDTNELYEYLRQYIIDHLRNDADYKSKIYRTLIFDYVIKLRDIAILLYDQNILEPDADTYEQLVNYKLDPYDFMTHKIRTMEITPAMLALEPCSGSIILTDPKTGTVECMVSYPSYDNNYFANQIDMTYYNRLLADKSYPLVFRATSSKTTTGSTFKPLSAIMGLMEGVITTDELIEDKGKFLEVDPSPRCWAYPNSHGKLTVAEAIRDSCNYYFFTVGYRVSINQRGEYIDALGIKTIQKYAKLFGLGDRSGVEVSESEPQISPKDAVRTAIGYYHSFAPIQIARYLTTIANEGTCYDLTLVSKVVGPTGETLMSNLATVRNKLDQIPQEYWYAVKNGMYNVVNHKDSGIRKYYTDLEFKVSGKTGTAQVSLNHPNNALFLSYAPSDRPEICVTVVIPNGYASANAAIVAREVYGYYFNGDNRDALLSGNVFAAKIGAIKFSD